MLFQCSGAHLDLNSFPTRRSSDLFDREAAVKLAGGSSLAVPTCQVLPPNFPGYVQYCPYTKDPAPNGAGPWKGPDIPKAKQLVQESGTAGMNVVVNTDGPDKPVGEQM